MEQEKGSTKLTWTTIELEWALSQRRINRKENTEPERNRLREALGLARPARKAMPLAA